MAIRMVKVAPFGWAVTATKWHYRADSGRGLSGRMLSGRGPRLPAVCPALQCAATITGNRARIGYSEQPAVSL
jgi:hypothetical protein